MQNVYTTNLLCNLLLQQSDEMMSGFEVPVLLIQMQLFFCVFLELLNKVGRDSFPDSQGQVNVLSSLNIVLLIQILICSHVSL